MRDVSGFGWPTKPLGDLVDVLDRLRKPITQSDRKAGPYPYYGATGVLDYVDGYLFDEPLVLIGEDGAKWEAGANSAFPIEGKVWVNNHAHVIRPHRGRVLDAWLIYYLNGSDLMPFVSGMTVPKLNQGRLREIPIPLPPLEEQQQIIAVLDEAFEGLALARAHAEANLRDAAEICSEFVRSAFQRSNERVVFCTVGDIITLQRGFDITKKDQSEGTVPVISSGGAKSFHSVATAKGPGVVVGRKGSIGSVYYTEEDYWPHDTTLWVKDFKGNNPRLVFHLLRGLKLQELDTGSANPSLNRNLVHPLEVYWPAQSDQDALTARIEDFESATHELSARYQSNLLDFDILCQSLLQRAFAGELTG